MASSFVPVVTSPPLPVAPGRPGTDATSIALVIESPGRPRDAYEQLLLERIRAGDAVAFETLYRAYHQPLLEFIASHLGSRAEAEDVVQDLMCRLWEYRGTWHARGTVRGYLYLAAQNRLRNYSRRGRFLARWRRHQGTHAASAGMSEGANDASSRVETAELITAARAAVEALPRRCRQAYVLRFQHHLSRPEIAAVMGISLKGVEIQLTTALKRLRAGLRDFI